MIGLGTYAFFWRHSERMSQPMTLIDAFEATRAFDLSVFQICDFAALDRMTDGELHDAAAAARSLGLTIELGTRGVAPEHLRRFLNIAEIFDAALVRSMLFSAESRPTLDEAEAQLRTVIRSYEQAGVTLALETYEQVATADLVAVIERVASPNLGVCLDPANVVAGLELPRECVERTAALVKNVHVKDFAFSRRDGWVGFDYGGSAMGSGRHDYRHLRDTVRPHERGINEIVEHWLPWQGDPETTARVEAEWTRTTIDYLRSME